MPDVEAIKARANLVKKGRPLRVVLVGVKHVERKCPECGTEFVTPYSDKRYCGESCRVRKGKRHIAQARQDISTLIDHIEKLEARCIASERTEAAIEGAKQVVALREALEDLHEIVVEYFVGEANQLPPIPPEFLETCKVACAKASAVLTDTTAPKAVEHPLDRKIIEQAEALTGGALRKAGEGEDDG